MYDYGCTQRGMMECAKVTVGVRKAKKKQGKDEFDRIKQAEKKKRRLEKALATSAAIRSELEKKKLKKKEEQERLDEEGAAIAEAVALQVLLGEDSDDSSKVMREKGLWDHASNIRRAHYNDSSEYCCESISRASDAYHCGQLWNLWEDSNLMVSSDYLGGDLYPQYLGEDWGPVGLSAGNLAAQVASSLKIDDAH